MLQRKFNYKVGYMFVWFYSAKIPPSLCCKIIRWLCSVKSKEIQFNVTNVGQNVFYGELQHFIIYVSYWQS